MTGQPAVTPDGGPARRLFVAAYPSAAAVEVLAGLPRDPTPGVRWVPPEQWHVTLRVLGAADPDAVVSALSGATLPAAVAELGPVVARLGRSVVMAPVSGLDGLAAAIRHATSTVGEPPDPRPFLGHLTLARLRGRGACGLAGVPVRARFDVREIVLVDSHLHHTGAVHTPLWRRSVGPVAD